MPPPQLPRYREAGSPPISSEGNNGDWDRASLSGTISRSPVVAILNWDAWAEFLWALFRQSSPTNRATFPLTHDRAWRPETYQESDLVIHALEIKVAEDDSHSARRAEMRSVAGRVVILASRPAIQDAYRSALHWESTEDLSLFDDLLHIRLDSPATAENWRTTIQAAAAIEDPTRDPLPFLLKALRVPAYKVIEEALYHLRHLRSERATLELIPLLQHEKALVRSDTAEILGILRDRRAIPALLAATGDADEMVRLCAAEALGAIGVASPEVLAALSRLLREDTYALTRLYAASALGDLGDTSVLPLLHEELVREVPSVRAWIYYALARLGEPFEERAVCTILRRGGYHARLQAINVLDLMLDGENTPRLRVAFERARQRETTSYLQERLTKLIAEIDGDTFASSPDKSPA